MVGLASFVAVTVTTDELVAVSPSVSDRLFSIDAVLDRVTEVVGVTPLIAVAVAHDMDQPVATGVGIAVDVTSSS